MARTHASCGVGAVVDLHGEPSHKLIQDGFQVLASLDHRGARGAEEDTGDGAGMLLQLPDAYFRGEVPGLPAPGTYCVGQAFLPRSAANRARLQRLIRTAVGNDGFRLLAWREVATGEAGLGATAAQSQPSVWQFFVAPERQMDGRELDIRLYVLRRAIETAAVQCCLTGQGSELFYICSLSRRTIVYKGLLTCSQLPRFYPELSDPRLVTRLALVHARFSTNTLGAWDLAHPYRIAIHNGEFNTLRGNLNWMRTREPDLASPAFGEALGRIKPVISDGLSDSAVFDNVLELLLLGGRELPHALRMMVPEAWHKDARMDADRRAFYAYHAHLMEPWDGPALVIATDGERVAAILDRNGLRPCRYSLSREGRLVMASEAGVLEWPPEQIAEQGRLRPGQILVADTVENRLVPEEETFRRLTQGRPYAQWVREQPLRLPELAATPGPRSDPQPCTDQVLRAFGYTTETLRMVVQKMAELGQDPLGSMGDDAPLAVLSARRRPLFDYFVQEFAQVSNPPLDHIREALVTSLEAPVGRHGNLLAETAGQARQLILDSPVLDHAAFEAIRTLETDPRNGLRSHRIPAAFAPGQKLRQAIDAMRQACEAAIREGTEVLILSDAGTGPDRIPIPSLLAVGAVHHHLIRRGLRGRVALVADSGEPCTVHHFCALIGYGADAVHPWLAYASLGWLREHGWMSPADDPHAAYRRSVEGGILKVMAKMGISTLASYKGAQIFECIGLDRDLVEEFFTGTTASLSGLGLARIEAEARARHAGAYGPAPGGLTLEQGGEFYWRRDGEQHQWNPYTIGKLQQAARNADRAAYEAFAAWHNRQDGHLQNLRGLLDLAVEKAEAVPLDEVEPAERILQRFATGSMSFGALSREAHEALAAAMNRIRGKSGTGEGGEQRERFGTERECSMKQIASGRFGVTAEYLANAREIEIKMAQGSKPGEGGELPGSKVDEGIAEVRMTVPGVGLISPPPHHDIYSIEDLAQLIHDLKCTNPAAAIHVKLVAKAGVGVIAAGVAKCGADAILISGHAGGTGASAKTSIKHAGSCWELGLAEAQRALLANRLRSRVALRVDGGLTTGRDVVIAALLGAEEFGFGTAPLVALGCIMLRKCHCNTCSVGVATQDPELRKRFSGSPDHVVNYLRFVAEEVRELMARLGARSLNQLVGRTELLRPHVTDHPRGFHVDLTDLLRAGDSVDAPYRTREQTHKLESKIDYPLVARIRPALEEGQRVAISMPIRNRDRSFGTLLSYVVTRSRGASGLPPGTVEIGCVGCAGQSFGAFLCRGISLELEGEANDYLGKGLSGGRIIVRAPAGAGYAEAGAIATGNVALYGATSGEAYINGGAGERFAVRNSGVLAVVEGVGDHACEYMTGGAVAILGPVGRNFGAGMSGGEAYVLDADQGFRAALAQDLEAGPVEAPRDAALLKRLVENHTTYTGSPRARDLLARWEEQMARFTKVSALAYGEVVHRHLAAGRDVRPASPEPAGRRLAA